MNNPDDKSVELDDDIYDDVLEDSFEDDFAEDDFADLDLDVEIDDDLLEEESEGYDVDAELEDFDGFEDDWDEDTDDAAFAGAGVQKEKRSFNMSFNAMAITGALLLGVAVLGYQVITKKPQAVIDRFTSALNMDGASDGPIFGDEEIKTTQLETIKADNNEDVGFLYDPDSLNKMDGASDGPPMPSPMNADPSVVDEILDITVNDAPAVPAIQVPDIEVSENPIPRPPEEVAVIEIPEKADNALDEFLEPQEDVVVENASKAENFLKKAMKKRETSQNSLDDLKGKTIQEPEDVKVVAAPKKVEQAIELAKTQATSADAFPVSNIEKKLDMIMSRLDDMEAQITQVREAGNVKIEGISDNVNDLKQELTQLAKAPIGAASKTTKPAPVKVATAPKKAAPKKATPKKSVRKAVKKKARAKPKAARVTWELRAAQPGKAWVSKKGQKDMRPVVVGDNLTGVGRITAISYNGSRWAVQGTSGRILQ